MAEKMSVQPVSSLRGELSPPGDKSVSHRSVMIGAIAEGVTEIENFLPGEDCMATIKAFENMGGRVSLEHLREESGEPVADLHVASSQLKGGEFGGDLIVRMLDEIPLLAVAATQADGEIRIRDAAELRVKETDRISATVSELRKLGAQVEELDDGMIIAGGSKLKGGECQSHGDHRMAMSLAVAGLVSESGVTIHDVGCVNTSFPGFWGMLSSLYS